MRNWWRAEKNRRSLLVPPIDTSRVEILVDANFRRSVEEVRKYTMLDVARLANLWYLAKLAGQGVFLEVGTYRGGGALHICNAIKDRGDPFYCFDPFEKGGFQTLGQEDAVFGKNDFMDTSYQAVSNLLAGMPNARVIQGFFPGAAKQIGIRNIAFCHLDVDVYEATRASLEYLAERLAPRSLIVLDDINRDIRGVDNAVSDFLKTHRSFLFLPMFPSQGLLLSKSLW
jgi:O-methyltransferase